VGQHLHEPILHGVESIGLVAEETVGYLKGEPTVTAEEFLQRGAVTGSGPGQKFAVIRHVPGGHEARHGTASTFRGGRHCGGRGCGHGLASLPDADGTGTRRIRPDCTGRRERKRVSPPPFFPTALPTPRPSSYTDRFVGQALDLITSPGVRDAFDLSKESPRTIDRYGKGKYSHQADIDILYDWDVKPFIQARRLVEAGVRVVTLQVGSWDHHSGAKQHIFRSYRHVLPVLDQSIHALVTDLDERGLLEDVLVVVLGEFGRTPKVSMPGPGREHWAEAGCVVVAGGGVKVGQVIGETDSRAERARSGRVTFQNLVATIYHILGIDPSAALPDYTGRPTPLLDDLEPVRELIG
jgi:hypothetical protein